MKLKPNDPAHLSARPWLAIFHFIMKKIMINPTAMTNDTIFIEVAQFEAALGFIRLACLFSA
jgi:hypothetical protein